MKSQEITFKVYSWATKTGIRRDCEWVGYIFKPPSNCITSVCCHATHLHTCLWKVFSLSFTSCGKSSSSSTYYWYQLVAFSIRHFPESCLKNRKLWSKNQLFWEKVTECVMSKCVMKLVLRSDFGLNFISSELFHFLRRACSHFCSNFGNDGDSDSVFRFVVTP